MKEMSLECQYCKKLITNKSNLTKHQKTAKHCLEIQKKLNQINPEIIIERISFDCSYCRKKFSSKSRLNNHLDSCNTRFNSIIEEKEAKIKELEEKMNEIEQKNIRLTIENELLREQSKESQSTINEIAKQPRVATTNNNHNKIMITTPVDLSQPTVQLAIQNGFSDEYMVQGQKGVARFAVENILKDEQGKLKYICTDAARQIFQYKNKDGSMQKDVRATKLTKALLEGELKSTTHKMACDKMKDGTAEEFNLYTDQYYEIKELETDNSNFSKELTSLTA